MPPKARGRPRRGEGLVKVWLQDSVYSLWNEKKGYTGFVKNTNSEFAEFLLNRTSVLGYLQRSAVMTASLKKWCGQSDGKSVVFLVEVLCIYLAYQVVFCHNIVIIIWRLSAIICVYCKQNKKCAEHDGKWQWVLGPVHTNAFSKTSVVCFLKTHKSIYVHISVFIAFSTIHTRPPKTNKNICFRHQSLLYRTFSALRMLGLK